MMKPQTKTITHQENKITNNTENDTITITNKNNTIILPYSITRIQDNTLTLTNGQMQTTINKNDAPYPLNMVAEKLLTTTRKKKTTKKGKKQ